MEEVSWAESVALWTLTRCERSVPPAKETSLKEAGYRYKGDAQHCQSVGSRLVQDDL